MSTGLNPDGLGLNRNFGTIGTGEASIGSYPASYTLYTDGTTIFAMGMGNDFTDLEGTDIGPIIDEILLNQLPPAGTYNEARGKIQFKAGDYPGTIDDQPLPGGVFIEGEWQNHEPMTDDTKATITRLSTSGTMFTQTNDGSPGENMSFIRVANITLSGPGHDVAGSRIFDSTVGSQTWDIVLIDNCSLLQAEAIADFSESHNYIKIKDCTLAGFGNAQSGFGAWIKGDEIAVVDSCDIFSAYTGNGGDPDVAAYIEGNQAKPGGGIRGSRVWANNPKRAVVIMKSGSTIKGSTARRFGSSDTSGEGIRLEGAQSAAINCYARAEGNSGGIGIHFGFGLDADNKTVLNCHVSDGFDESYFGNAGANHTIAYCSDDGSQAVRSLGIGDAGPATDVNVAGTANRFSGSVELDGTPTRPRWNGVIGGGPFGGVDLGSTTGQFVGDLGISDGTTNTAGKMYRWDGSAWSLIA